MLNLHHSLRIYIATQPIKMSLSFRGLLGLIRGQLHEDPTKGQLFCFFNKRRNMLKMLLCDSSGIWIFYKRLSMGTFEMPPCEDAGQKVVVDPATLALLLDGIDLASIKRRKRYQRPLPDLAETAA